MKADEIRALCGEELTDELLEGINPLRIHESIEFKRRFSDGNYRDRAIAKAIKSRVPFSSTANSCIDLLKKFVSIKCPHCEGGTEARGAGGSGDSCYTEFRCVNSECQTTVVLSMDWNGFSVRPTITNQYKK